MMSKIIVSSQHQALEYVKCKNNFLYFLHNYIMIPEVGGSSLYAPELMHDKFKRTVQCSLKYGRVILMATRQLGKALSLNTPIPLPNGEWTSMEDLKVGDIILGSDGLPTKVINATDVMYDHNCYKIEFDYAAPIIADADHLWKVDWNKTKDKIVNTLELKRMLETPDTILNINGKMGEYSHYVTAVTKVKSVPVRCIEVDALDKMFLCGDFIPTHNSTISAAILEYLLNFFPNNRAIILNMSKTAGLENIGRIKFMHDNLPEFLKSPHKNKAVERKTFLEYDNGSKVTVFFPSSATSPDTLARSLSSPIKFSRLTKRFVMKNFVNSVKPYLIIDNTELSFKYSSLKKFKESVTTIPKGSTLKRVEAQNNLFLIIKQVMGTGLDISLLILLSSVLAYPFYKYIFLMKGEIYGNKIKRFNWTKVHTFNGFRYIW